MTDRPEKSSGEGEGPGAQLRRAREGRGLLLHDVAQDLHLDEWMLQALEEDDFAALGAPVFTKGHMRKYGEMLGLNADDLMIAYYRKRGRDDSPPPITKMQAPESPGRKLEWATLAKLLAVAIAGIVVYLVWSIITRGGGQPEQAQAPVLPPSGTQLAQETTASPSTPLPDADDTNGQSLQIPGSMTPTDEDDTTLPGASDSADLADADAVEIEISPATEEQPPADTPLTEVRLVLTGESWVEVTDSDGVRLIYDMMSEGRVRTVSGRPPIEIFLGLSRAVQVEVDGQSYPIPRTAVRGNTARFVIEPDTPQ